MVVSLIAAGSAAASAWATVVLAKFAKQQVKANADLVDASLAEVKQVTLARYDDRLPLLIPIGETIGNLPPNTPDDAPLEVVGQIPGNHGTIKLKNLGKGPAFNIWVTIYAVNGPAPNHIFSLGWLVVIPDVMSDNPLADKDVRQYNSTDVTQIPALTELTDPDTLQRVKLAPDPERVGALVFRVTSTYADIYGRKHASVFNFIPTESGRSATWHFIAHLQNIDEDIRDLHHRYAALVARKSQK